MLLIQYTILLCICLYCIRNSIHNYTLIILTSGVTDFIDIPVNAVTHSKLDKKRSNWELFWANVLY